MQRIEKSCPSLKLDKGQGIDLINRINYNSSMEHVFNDTSKFQILNDDVRLRNFSTIQNYFNTWYKREITLEERIIMCPKFTQVGRYIQRAHELSKIHED